MRTILRATTIVPLALLLIVSATGSAQRATAPPAEATARIVAAAKAVLASLDEAGRAKVQFPFDGPQKTRWSNLPSPMFERRGLLLADLTPAQRGAVTTLLTTALSRDGYRKVTEIMRGDEVLKKYPGAPPGGAVAADAAAAAPEAREAAARASARISTTSPSSARPPRPRRGCCSSAVTISRLT